MIKKEAAKMQNSSIIIKPIKKELKFVVSEIIGFVELRFSKIGLPEVSDFNL